MKTFLITLIVLGLAVFGMCFNIIFRKNGKFPEYEVGSNEQMRKKGIKCMHQEELEENKRIKNKKKELNCNESCSNCRETECR